MMYKKCYATVYRTIAAQNPDVWYYYIMITISIDEIQRDLLAYLYRVRAGETVVVLQAGQPVAEIKPVTPNARERRTRPFGLCAGEFAVPADFDEPLPEEILNQFEGK